MNWDDERCEITGLKRYSCAHCQPEKVVSKCGAKTYHGNSCTNYAGEGTPHLGTGFCELHDYQGQKLIPHESKKLSGNTIHCRSQYEKYALQALDDDLNVYRYQYEKIELAYTLGGHQRTYKPDLLVTYSDGKEWIIEVKSIRDNVLSEENYFKFKSADLYTSENGMHFAIWVYTYGKKEVWSWERFRELAPHFPRLEEKAISDGQAKMQSIKRKSILRKGPKL